MPPRSLFADTFYWIALLFPRDAFHVAVVSFSRTLGSVRLVTTDEVLTEVLSHFASLGPYWRGKRRPWFTTCAVTPSWTFCRKPAPTSTRLSPCTRPGPTRSTA